MKHFFKIISLFFLVSCSAVSRLSDKSIVGKYVYHNINEKEYSDSCVITLYNNNRFIYGCRFYHFGTTVEGIWNFSGKNQIILSIDKKDILPTYPSKFYNEFDTLIILNSQSIKHGEKIFNKI